MSNDTNTINDFVDLLDVGPVPAPQPGTKAFRQTVRVAQQLQRATAELVALSPEQRRPRAFKKISELFGYGYGPSRLKISSQPGNPADRGTVFVNMVKAVRGLRQDGASRVADPEEFDEIVCRLHNAIEGIGEIDDIRVRAIQALLEFLKMSGIGVDA